MQTLTKKITDDNENEIEVVYDFEKGDSQIEEGHGMHEVGLLEYIKVQFVFINIFGVNTSIKELLTEKQLNSIINKLSKN